MARKSKFEDYKNVREIKGRNGQPVLVFRHPLVRQKTLPGELGSEEFVAAYEALRLLVEAPAAVKVEVKLPTFRDAFTEFKKTERYLEYTKKTKTKYEQYAVSFLDAAVSPDDKMTFAETEVSTAEAEILPLLRGHVATLNVYEAKRVTILIRYLYETAIERIDGCRALRNLGNDIAIKDLPKATPQKRWPEELMDQFEAFHKPGTPARTAFALGKFLGARCGDASSVEWTQLKPHRHIDANGNVRVSTVIEFWTRKNAKRGANTLMKLFVRPELEEVLNALDRSKGGTILKREDGDSYAETSLTTMMRLWCEQADIPPGYTMHGLRRTFASEIAEGGADPFAVQKAMGHKHVSTTTVYLDELDATPMTFRAAEAAERRSAEIRKLKLSEQSGT